MAATGTAAAAGNNGGGATSSGAAGATTAKKKVTKATGAGTTAKKKVVRKKKVVKKVVRSEAGANPARAAQLELAAKRNKQAARRNDPLWYKIEDVLPPNQGETEMAASGSILQEQFQIVESALENNNMTPADVTPQAFACLLEQSRRYALELIADAQDYAYVAGRKDITKADLALADEMRPDHPVSLTTQLPKLSLLAGRLNRVPLPPIPPQCYSGVLLPPKQHQLTARTFDVVSGARVAQRMVQAAPSAPTKKSKATTSKPSYGANLGRQIPIKLKETPAPEKKDSGGPAPMDTSTTSPAVKEAATPASAPATNPAPAGGTNASAPSAPSVSAGAPAPSPSAPEAPATGGPTTEATNPASGNSAPAPPAAGGSTGDPAVASTDKETATGGDKSSAPEAPAGNQTSASPSKPAATAATNPSAGVPDGKATKPDSEAKKEDPAASS